MISEETIEKVREAADIVQIIGEQVKLRRMGRNYRGPCPLHGGKNPNFSVSPDKGVYHCFTCHESGNVFTFLEKTLGVDYPTAIRIVAEKVGVEVVETIRRTPEKDTREPFWELNATAGEYFQRMLWEGEAGAAARAYLDSRGITRAVGDRFGIGYAPPANALMTYLTGLGFDEPRLLEAGLLSQRDGAGEAFSRFRDRLMIPIHDVAGHPVGFGGRLLAEREGAAKYLNSPETPVFAKRRLLYNLHQAKNAIRRADRVILVEGYFDVVRIASAGVEEVVAPLGTALTPEQAALLTRYAKNVFLLYDSDDAGLKATFRSGLELLTLGASVRVVSLPEGEDPDTFVSKYGRERLEAQLADAIDVFDRQVQILERKGWFADLHRRRRAIDKLLPTIRATADALTREIYVARLSEAAGVTRELLVAEAAAGDRPRRGGAPRGGGSSSGPDAPPDDGAPPPDEPPPFDGGGGGFRRRGFDRRRRYGRREVEEWRSTEAPPKISAGAGPERELLRVMLRERGRVEVVAERHGRDAFRNPAYREIFWALLDGDADTPLEEIASALPDGAARLLDSLVGEPLVGDPEVVFGGALHQLRVRELDEEIARLQAEIQLADGDEKDRLIARKNALSKERRVLGARQFKVGRSLPRTPPRSEPR